jgi:hypothetical protein
LIVSFPWKAFNRRYEVSAYGYMLGNSAAIGSAILKSHSIINQRRWRLAIDEAARCTGRDYPGNINKIGKPLNLYIRCKRLAVDKAARCTAAIAPKQ